MRKISAFQIVLLASFGAFAVAGVLIFAFAVSGNNSSVVGQVTIWGTLPAAPITQTLQELSDADPDFEQVSYVEKDPATIADELVEALAAGGGPDLYVIRDDDAYESRDRVAILPYESLSRERFESTFIDAASPYLGQAGVIGIPLVADPLVLYWNRDILSNAGYAKPPAYWDEINEFTRIVTKRSESGGIGVSALSFGEYQNVQHAKEIVGMLILQAGGVLTSYDTEGRLVSALSLSGAGGLQAATNALRFYTEFADPSKEKYTWNRSLPNSRQAFAAGDAALFIGLYSEAKDIQTTNPNINFSLAPIPQRRDVHAVGGGYVYALAIPRTAKNRTGATAIAYKLAGDSASELLSERLGLASARRDVLAKRPPKNELLNSQTVIMRSWVDPATSETDTIFRGMIEDTTSGAFQLSDALQRADRQLQNLLQP